MKIETFLSRPEGKTLEFKSGTNINPDTLDVRVASGLFAGFRNWKERSLLLVEGRPGERRFGGVGSHGAGGGDHQTEE